MMKNWKYSVMNDDGEIIKGIFAHTQQTATQICYLLESQGYDVLSLSCVEELPKWGAIIPFKRRPAYV